MIWATVRSQLCFCWLYWVSPSLAAKIIAAAAWCWNDCEVISLWGDTLPFSVQGQRSLIKTAGTGAVAAPCWGNFEDIPHVQGQRGSTSKMVGGAKLHLESNPTPIRDVQRAQINLVCTRTQRPHRDWDRTVFECLLWRYISAVDCCRGRGSGCIRLGLGAADLGMA